MEQIRNEIGEVVEARMDRAEFDQLREWDYALYTGQGGRRRAMARCGRQGTVLVPVTFTDADPAEALAA